MASSYPTSLDTFTNPTGADNLDSPDHAGQHSDANDAVESLEAKVGTGAGTPTEGKVLRGGATAGSATWQNRDVAYVSHGATAATARPVGATSVKWVGSVEPTNATSADEWWDTTNSLLKSKASGSFVASGSGTYVTVLDRVRMYPTSADTKTTTSTSFVAVDSTNLTVDFTAPTTEIDVVAVVPVLRNGTGYVYLGLLEASDHTTIVTGTPTLVVQDEATRQNIEVTFAVTGLTVGQTYSWDLGWRVSAGTATTDIGSTAGQFGAALMKVLSVPPT